MILGWLTMLALGAEPDRPELAPAAADADGSGATSSEVHRVSVTPWVGGGLEPVRGPASSAVVGRVSVQLDLAERFSLEAGAGLHRLGGSQQALTSEFDPELVVSRFSNPRGTADLRVQLTLIQGELSSRRRPVPLALTLDLGGGAVWTRDDARILQCDRVEGEPCTETLEQVHPVPLLGSTLTLSPTERLRVRGVVQWRTWVETYNGVELERMGSTTLTLEIGAELGPRPERQRSKFQAPLPPESPLYRDTL